MKPRRRSASPPVSYPTYLDWRSESQSFTDIGAFRLDNFNFTGSGEPEQLTGGYVSASFLPVLGVHPRLGRVFSAAGRPPGRPLAR
jgi:putative ABC transport system permease protein